MPAEPAPAPATPVSRLRVAVDGAVTVVQFAGKHPDGNSVRELFELATSLTHRTGPRLLVDLTGLVLATSGLMGMLTTIHKRMLAAGGALAVAIPDPRLLEAFQVTRLDLLLKLAPDAAAARAQLA